MPVVSRITLRGAKKASVSSQCTVAGGIGTGVLLVDAVGIEGWFATVLDRPTAYAQTFVE
jgi:hypothetical protein